jgi:hypothetical protein
VEFLLQAIDELHEEKKITPQAIGINFFGIRYFRDQEERILNYKPHLRDYFFCTWRLPSEEIARLNSQSDFLVSLTEAGNPIISAKTYDYLSVKVPILVVPGDRSILSHLIEELQAGYSFYSVQQLKDFLVEQVLRKQKNHNRYPSSLNTDKASFYSRMNQSKLFAANLQSLLRS